MFDTAYCEAAWELCRVLLDKKKQQHKGAQEVLAALSFLEVEERTGRMNLDVTETRYVISRFCELGRLDTDEVHGCT